MQKVATLNQSYHSQPGPNLGYRLVTPKGFPKLEGKTEMLTHIKARYALTRSDYLNYSREVVQETAKNESHIHDINEGVKRTMRALDHARGGEVVAKRQKALQIKGDPECQLKPTFDNLFLERKRNDLVKYEKAKLEEQLEKGIMELERLRENQGPMDSGKEVEEEVVNLRSLIDSSNVKINITDRLNKSYISIIDLLRRDEGNIYNILAEMARALAYQKAELDSFKKKKATAQGVSKDIKKFSEAREKYFNKHRYLQELEAATMQSKFAAKNDAEELYEYINGEVNDLLNKEELEAAELAAQHDKIRSKIVFFEDILHRITEATTSNTVEEMLRSFESQARLMDRLQRIIRMQTIKMLTLQQELVTLYDIKFTMGRYDGNEEIEMYNSVVVTKNFAITEKMELDWLTHRAIRVRSTLLSCQDGARALRDVILEFHAEPELPIVDPTVGGPITRKALIPTWTYCANKVMKLWEAVEMQKRAKPDVVMPRDMNEYYDLEETHIDEVGPNIRVPVTLPGATEESDSEEDDFQPEPRPEDGPHAPTRLELKLRCHRVLEHQKKLLVLQKKQG